MGDEHADRTPRWEQRFRAPAVSVPSWAADAPDRCVYTSTASGTTELVTWDLVTGEHVQATRRPSGTSLGRLTPDGSSLWWFDDTKGDEKGIWRSQPFGAGPGDAGAALALDPGYPTGLAFSRTGAVAVGLAADGRHRVFVVDSAAGPRLVHDHHEGSRVLGWAHDGALLALTHAEHGDNRNHAARVVTSDGDVVADLWDGSGRALVPFEWAPAAGDQRLLVAHERRGRRHPAVWSPLTGEVDDLDADLDGQLLAASWFPGGHAVLLVTIGRGRGQLWRHDLRSGATEAVETGGGMLTGARVRPDGTVWWAGSTAATPPVVHCGDQVLQPPGPRPPGGVGYQDLLVDGPGGPVHAFVAVPAGPGPHPTVVLVHGGPAGVDADAFTPEVQAWVDHGFAVALVNYRGSTGYGKAWEDAIVGRPGYRELEDIGAVRDHLVEGGLADPARLVLHGGSWGGYLTLLGVGTQPDAWSLGIAAVPLASLRDHYHQQGEVLQAYWRSLFGGTPETLGDALDAIDPVVHVGRIRVPVFVLVGDNDPRCPLEQVLTYVAALERAGVEHELLRFDAGHATLVLDERIEQLARCIDFAACHLGTRAAIVEEAP